MHKVQLFVYIFFLITHVLILNIRRNKILNIIIYRFYDYIIDLFQVVFRFEVNLRLYDYNLKNKILSYMLYRLYEYIEKLKELQQWFEDFKSLKSSHISNSIMNFGHLYQSQNIHIKRKLLNNLFNF